MGRIQKPKKKVAASRNVEPYPELSESVDIEFEDWSALGALMEFIAAAADVEPPKDDGSTDQDVKRLGSVQIRKMKEEAQDKFAWAIKSKLEKILLDRWVPVAQTKNGNPKG